MHMSIAILRFEFAALLSTNQEAGDAVEIERTILPHQGNATFGSLKRARAE